MILTYKLKHNRDFTKELKSAFNVAEYTLRHKFLIRSSKDLKEVRGSLPAVIAAQVARKFKNQKHIKILHNANLTIPGQVVKFIEETNSIWIPCLNLHLESNIPYIFTKINQVEIDKEFVYIVMTIKEQPEMIPKQFIGVDRNTTGHTVVTANPDTGKIEKMGKSPLYIHYKYKHIRRRLQKQKRYKELSEIKNREHNIINDLNHKISRKIVNMANAQNAALVFEDLKNIRKTGKKNYTFNFALDSWSFYEFQTFVEYKAKLLGVPVLYVDPSYTSQNCSRCGAKGLRQGKEFKCPACGHVDHADVNAAFNIALRQKSMVDCMQKEMCTMGALIPHLSNDEECNRLQIQIECQNATKVN
jgi:putative transposase